MNNRDAATRTKQSARLENIPTQSVLKLILKICQGLVTIIANGVLFTYFSIRLRNTFSLMQSAPTRGEVSIQ